MSENKHVNPGALRLGASAFIVDQNGSFLREVTPEALAIEFHETYERMAPDFGHETRQDTRQFDPETPNGRLMIAVCADIISRLTVDIAIAMDKEAPV